MQVLGKSEDRSRWGELWAPEPTVWLALTMTWLSYFTLPLGSFSITRRERICSFTNSFLSTYYVLGIRIVRKSARIFARESLLSTG